MFFGPEISNTIKTYYKETNFFKTKIAKRMELKFELILEKKKKERNNKDYV